MKYRDLGPNELVQVGDVACTDPENDAQITKNGSPATEGESCVGARAGIWTGRFWHRPIPGHNWIAFSDRNPTAEDADNVGDVQGCVLVLVSGYERRSVHFASIGNQGNATHWMPLHFNSPEPARIKVDGKEVIPQKDGSVKLGCGTIIPKGDVEEFLRQREAAMKVS